MNDYTARHENEVRSHGIMEVWAKDVEAAFDSIKDVVESYPYIAVDTEFPGIVMRPTGVDGTLNTYNYHTVKQNVDALKVIQLGITFADSLGNLPENGGTWQFNFKFDIGQDLYAQDSIDFLKKSGVDFARHQGEGIEPHRFGELIMASGLVMNDNVRWIAFHGSYDFGYLLKLLTCDKLPGDEVDFFRGLNVFIPSLYDIKYLLRNVRYLPLSGGLSLQNVAEHLKVKRSGPSHQAGPDSLVTCHTFFKIMEAYFDNQIDDSMFAGVIYGLGLACRPHPNRRLSNGCHDHHLSRHLTQQHHLIKTMGLDGPSANGWRPMMRRTGNLMHQGPQREVGVGHPPVLHHSMSAGPGGMHGQQSMGHPPHPHRRTQHPSRMGPNHQMINHAESVSLPPQHHQLRNDQNWNMRPPGSDGSPMNRVTAVNGNIPHSLYYGSPHHIPHAGDNNMNNVSGGFISQQPGLPQRVDGQNGTLLMQSHPNGRNQGVGVIGSYGSDQLRLSGGAGGGSGSEQGVGLAGNKSSIGGGMGPDGHHNRNGTPGGIGLMRMGGPSWMTVAGPPREPPPSPSRVLSHTGQRPTTSGGGLSQQVAGGGQQQNGGGNNDLVMNGVGGNGIENICVGEGQSSWGSIADAARRQQQPHRQQAYHTEQEQSPSQRPPPPSLAHASQPFTLSHGSRIEVCGMAPDAMPDSLNYMAA